MTYIFRNKYFLILIALLTNACGEPPSTQRLDIPTDTKPRDPTDTKPTEPKDPTDKKPKVPTDKKPKDPTDTKPKDPTDPKSDKQTDIDTEIKKYLEDKDIQLLGKTTEELQKLVDDILKRYEQDPNLLKDNPSDVFEILKIRILQKNDIKANFVAKQLINYEKPKNFSNLVHLLKQLNQKKKELTEFIASMLPKIKNDNLGAFKELSDLNTDLAVLLGTIKGKITVAAALNNVELPNELNKQLL